VNLRKLRTWPLPPRMTTWQSLAVGVAILLGAALLRLALDYLVPGRLAFTTYFPATVVAAYLTGAPGGLVVLAGGLLGSLLTWGDLAEAPNFAVALVGDGVFGLTGAAVVLALAALREAIFELAEQDARARIINRELMHRSRNQYAVITTLATQTMRRAGIGRDVTEALTDRILALAQAQDLVSLDPRQDISLERLVEQVVVPMAPEPSRISISGTAIGISANLVSDLSLVFHELATNALKHGAWSSNRGCVALSWQRAADGVSIRWKEQDGPPPAMPDPGSSGLGTVLIDNAIRGGATERRFEATGLIVTLRVPLEGFRVIRAEGGQSRPLPALLARTGFVDEPRGLR
jgi:two-component sensor histidine kinase